jgi:hypothetical protein
MRTAETPDATIQALRGSQPTVSIHISSRYPEVARRSRLPLREFRREYLYQKKPVVITDAIDSWSARSLWTFDFFKSFYGDVETRVYRYDPATQFTAGAIRNVRLGDHIDNVQRYDWSAYPYYLRDDWRLIHEHAELRTHYEKLEYFFDWFQLFPEFMRMPYPRLFIGPRGAITPLHVDVWRTHAWLTQFVGRKRWILFPPDQEHLLYGCSVRVDEPDFAKHPLFRAAKPVEATVGPGDTIFVPTGWPHYVVSLDATLSLTGNYMGPGCFRSCLSNTFRTFVVDRIRSTARERVSASPNPAASSVRPRAIERSATKMKGDTKVGMFLYRLSAEPPFRLVTRALVKRFASSIHAKAWWDAVDRPHYLMGVLRAADQAKRQDIPEICVAEFGVARGHGLLCLQRYAEEVENETGIRIRVYGFDTGRGLPQLCGDHRDHPDFYQVGDYPGDVEALQSKLASRTSLVIGELRDTIECFVKCQQTVPLGFAAIDVDFYTSTRDALRVLSHPDRKILNRVFLYFDELDLHYFHQYAGEFLAINEFNALNTHVKIDKWHGVQNMRPFPENPKLVGMYICHDLESISKVVPSRAPVAHAT